MSGTNLLEGEMQEESRLLCADCRTSEDLVDWEEDPAEALRANPQIIGVVTKTPAEVQREICADMPVS
ncbi:MAG TPA: hypothetical protein PLV72_02220 [Candidatus Magasanikbacteria bacterium]|nr:hypothetical protein [Candidatus Magasanikbacteria bacterium]